MSKKEKIRKEKKKKQRTTKNVNLINNNKGITLIALVITIIVLLILAGVTINLTLGENGIFRTAEQAGRNYTQAQEQEIAGLAEFENTINNIIAGTGNSGGNGTDTPELPENALKRLAQPGDYVKYDTGIDGIGDNQDGILTFRVLYNDEANGLQIISDKRVERVTLGTDGYGLEAFQASMDDYNNAIEILNNAANAYAENSPYALDGRCVGSVPTVGADGTFTAKNTEETATYRLPDEYTLPSGWVSRDTGCKNTDTNYEADYDTMEALEDSGIPNILTTGYAYYLASRNVECDSSYCDFTLRVVSTDGSLESDLANTLGFLQASGDTHGESNGSGLRPCISLNPNVKVVGGGDGSEEAQAYELGI